MRVSKDLLGRMTKPLVFVNSVKFDYFWSFGKLILLEGQRRQPKRFFFIEKETLVSGTEARVDSLGPKVMLESGGASPAEAGSGSGSVSARPGSSSSWASAGLGSGSLVFSCWLRSQAAG